ncbi:uncharacterized protein LOC117574892 [Drosophila albomicans]|uniref:Uncharacterized protein LOC117574892 n=1 Tax=Drosophila albomicans TaxID=7291 RepID=A0A6P8XER1_DROAB|nr:uncharacterized protein LOC117574892 [Drosophila albomicans]
MKLFMRNAAATTISIRMTMMELTTMMTMLLPLLLLAMCMRNANASVAATNRTCKHATNMWGDPNPNIFYVCTAADQMPLQLHCPQGRGFFNGLGHLGCLPYDQWPACRSLNFTATSAAPSAVDCDSGSGSQIAKTIQHQPWATLDPNQFYMCPGVNATPLLLNCAPGKGFVQTSQSVGCADWPHWRRQMQCESYF